MEKSRRSTFQVALACALGALACALIAIATGFHIGYGILAGCITGYVAYEFRDVCRAIPIAFRAALRGSVSIYDTNIARLQEWRSRPHPFLYPAMLITAPFYTRGLFSLMTSLVIGDWPKLGRVAGIAFSVVGAPFALLAFIEASWFVAFPMVILAFIGARAAERSYWWPMMMVENPAQAQTDAAILESKGLRQQALTYRNVGRWIAKGLGLTLLFFVWTLWKYVVIYAGMAIAFIARMLWALFKLIHSYERVLCALDGTIGGTVAYQFFISPERSIAQNAIAVAFGMVLGIGFGLVNYEIVSKRVLKVVPVGAGDGGD